jgi:hypothetical protein
MSISREFRWILGMMFFSATIWGVAVFVTRKPGFLEMMTGCDEMACLFPVFWIMLLSVSFIVISSFFFYRNYSKSGRNKKMMIALFFAGMIPIGLWYAGMTMPNKIATILEKQRIQKEETRILKNSISIERWKENKDRLLMTAEFQIGVDFQGVGEYRVDASVVDSMGVRYFGGSEYITTTPTSSREYIFYGSVSPRIVELSQEEYLGYYKQDTERVLKIGVYKMLPDHSYETVDVLEVAIDENGNVVERRVL